MDEKPQNESKAIPLSGQIVGAIVSALDIKDEALTDKTAKRYYSGMTVSERSLRRIYLSLGKRLVDLGIVPAPPLFQQYHVSMANITAASLAQLARKWDSLCATIQSRSGRIEDYDQAIHGFCRLIVIDLALRVFAWMRLAKLPPPEAKTPLWAEENGPGKTLRLLLSEADITREQFGARVGVSHISIDNWFDGKVRPVPNHIQIMADTFSELIPGAKRHALQVRFQRDFTLAFLADILAGKIGREAVIELATALHRFIRFISEDVEAMARPPIEEAAGLEFEMLRHGVGESHSHTLLRNLALVETDPNWKRDILASTTGWGLRFEEIAGRSCSPGASAGLAQELPEAARAEEFKDGTEEDLKRLGEASLIQPNDYARIVSGDLRLLIELLDSGINDCRLIVRRHPLSPRAHMELGSYLGMAGGRLRDREMINEGIGECRIAAALCEGWDAPLVEAGIILGNAGYYDEALVDLNAAASKLRTITPHLALNRGYVLMQTKRYEEALNDFESVISARPEYAAALDYAAHCAFMAGDRVKGIKYAKEARRHGRPKTYSDWRGGAYRRQKTMD